MNKSIKFYMLYFLCFILILTIANKPKEEVERLAQFKLELSEKESWMLAELDDIAKFLEFDNKEITYYNREVLFISKYVSPEFNSAKLMSLYDHLIGKGWIDVTGKVDRNSYINTSAVESDETENYLRVLCNDKATLFMYLTDMQNEYIIDKFNVRTLIQIRYSYTLPCYDLNYNNY